MSIVRIGDVCTWSKGFQVPRDETASDKQVPYLHYGDLYKLYGFRMNLEENSSIMMKINDGRSLKAKQMLHDGDIVFALTSETVDDLSRCTLLISSHDNLGGTYFAL